MNTSLVCPKCQAPMRSYERNGVTIEQCTECRGIFLDRGELETLIGAEAAFNAGPAAPGMGSAPVSGGHHGEGGHGGPSWGGQSRSKRRKGFLGELFD